MTAPPSDSPRLLAALAKEPWASFGWEKLLPGTYEALHAEIREAQRFAPKRKVEGRPSYDQVAGTWERGDPLTDRRMGRSGHVLICRLLRSGAPVDHIDGCGADSGAPPSRCHRKYVDTRPSVMR